MSAAKRTSWYEVTVLQEGYAFTTESGEDKADGTVTLIKGPTNVLVDTGGPADREKILNALHKEGLTPADIDTVVGTHGHSDHIGNLNLFPHATVIVSYDISHGDTYISNRLGKGEPYKLDEFLKVLPTPGHTGSDVSVVVRNTSIGTVVVAGDLFECEDDLTDSTIWRDVSEQPKVQEKNRLRVLQIADYIVPGHGKMFHVSPAYKVS